jgi:hypothetical protein
MRVPGRHTPSKYVSEPTAPVLTCLPFPHNGRVPHTPGFPVKFVGVDELHAAFLNESRTRGRCLVPRTGNLGISLVFREMWESTILSL